MDLWPDRAWWQTYWQTAKREDRMAMIQAWLAERRTAMDAPPQA